MRIEHIALWVSDLEKMKSFYETYFQAQAGKKYHNPHKNFSSYFLTFESGTRLEIMYKPQISNLKDTKTLGLAHFAVSVGNENTVNRLTKLLAQDDFKVLEYPRWTGDGYYESKVFDPENNLIEITM